MDEQILNTETTTASNEENNFNLFAAMNDSAKEPENDNDSDTDTDLNLNNIMDTDLLAAVIVPGMQSLNKMVMRIALKNKVDVSKYHFKNAEDLEKIISLWLKTVEIKNPKQIIGWILMASIADNMGGMWADAISDTKKAAASIPASKSEKEIIYTNFKDSLSNGQK